MKNVLVWVLFFFFLSCNSNDKIQNENSLRNTFGIDFLKIEESSNSFLFEYRIEENAGTIRLKSTIENGKIISQLFPKVKNSDFKILDEVIIDTNIKNYKDSINIKVIQKAETIKTYLSIDQIVLIEKNLSNLPEILFNKLGESEYYKPNPLTLFYHMAIFKSAKRSIETNNKTCDCGKYENYYEGRSPFFCNEDKIVETAELIKTIEKIISKSKFSEKFKAEKTFSFLKKTEKSFISVSDVDSILRDEFKEFYEQNEDLKSKNSRLCVPIDVTCLLFGACNGSDCGCCGNYSGLCWLCNLACYVHDQTCTDCKPRWYCFSGCVPGPC